MKYNRINKVVGWMVFAIACTVYLMTMERTTSFWDTGEFISGAYKLQIPHPPGAPLFLLIGRFFVILFGDNPATAAIAVNSMSAIASGFTILFLFWTITYFAKKIVQGDNGSNNKELRNTAKNTEAGHHSHLGNSQLFTIMGTGVVGALSYTFSDSFWFSAVEGEVYALSSFFTAIVFWAALKWELRADQPGADRWLVFIFFLMGLSIGVHLLNLLTIPAIVMVYYFRKYKVSIKGTIMAFLAGCLLTGLVQIFVIQYTIKGAGAFDVFFVNSLGLPFFSGFSFFFVLIAVVLLLTIRYASRKRYHYLKVATFSLMFMLLGYSTYLTTMLRSNANPAMDMFNVDNPIALEGYLGREQYGDWPIIYGPDFTEPAPVIPGNEVFTKSDGQYVSAGRPGKSDWANAPGAHLFPRMWDAGNDRNQHSVYRNYAGLEEGETPTLAHNIKYFASYQAGWMYMRYFMWNFAGKQNDLQGYGNIRDSNWISGLPFVDNVLYGPQENLPDSIHRENKAHNELFMLPLALGIAGMFFQYKTNRQQFFVNLLLFFFTGLAIVIYINQAGLQPRERDYSFVGSFYAFAVWIGLGSLWVSKQFARFVKPRHAAYAGIALCMTVPVLMAAEEWDDHDRSRKTLARDMAKNYLESCPKNAILFSFEDNDTYPLWYAQEVEGIRPDVRVMVNTLTGTDWYLNQLRYKVNDSAPFDVIFTKEQTQGNNREVLYYSKLPGFDQDKYYDLYSTLKNVVASDDPRYTGTTEDGETYQLLPMRKFSVPVNADAVRKNGLVNPGDSIVSELKLDLSAKNYLLRNDLTMLSIIATSNFERPVCFTSNAELGELGLDKYARLEGLVYRLVPVENSEIDHERSYKHIMEKFEYGNTDKEDVYLDEDNRRRLNIIKLAHAQLAISLANAGKNDKARNILHRFESNVNSSNLPHGMTSNRGNQHNAISSEYLRAAYLSGDLVLANKISTALKKDLRQQLDYYRQLGDEALQDEQLAQYAYQRMQGAPADLSEKQLSFLNDIVSSFQLLRQLESWENAPAK
ncbi:glycosyltransferase family 117 protein [Flavitalea antarctica]